MKDIKRVRSTDPVTVGVIISIVREAPVTSNTLRRAVTSRTRGPAMTSILAPQPTDMAKRAALRGTARRAAERGSTR